MVGHSRKAGGKIEWLWLKLIRKEHKYIKELPDAKTTRRMVREAKASPPSRWKKSAAQQQPQSGGRVGGAASFAPVQPALFDEKGQAAEPLPSGEYSKPSLALLRNRRSACGQPRCVAANRRAHRS